jgi:hypothetical protein
VNDKLRTRFERLEVERHQLLKIRRSISLEQFNRAPTGKWSVHQVLAHLIAAEKISVAYINNKFKGIDEVANTGFAEDVKVVLLKISQRLPLKFKAPAVVVANTPVYADFQHLEQEWDLEREELRMLLEKFDGSQLRKKIYNHIVIGRLNIEQALIFFREHFFHHLPQIRRLC